MNPQPKQSSFLLKKKNHDQTVRTIFPQSICTQKTSIPPSRNLGTNFHPLDVDC